MSDNQPHHCLLNRLFRYRSQKTSKLRVTGLCAGTSPLTGEFPSQRASNAENVSIRWRHHVTEMNQRWPYRFDSSSGGVPLRYDLRQQINILDTYIMYQIYASNGTISLVTFLLSFSNRYNIQFNVIWLLENSSLQIFTHATTAQLPCNVQNMERSIDYNLDESTTKFYGI